jgi:hypothetical protein
MGRTRVQSQEKSPLSGCSLVAVYNSLVLPCDGHCFVYFREAISGTHPLPFLTCDFRARGVAQALEHLPGKRGPEFKLQYHKQINKQKI